MWPSRFAEDLAIDTAAREFELQFAAFHPSAVERAVTAAIAESDFMPTPAKIKEKLRETKPIRHHWKADDDGDHYHANTPEEVERRKAQCKAWRKQYGFASEAEKPGHGEAVDLETLKRPFTEAEIESAARLNAVQP